MRKIKNIVLTLFKILLTSLFKSKPKTMYDNLSPEQTKSFEDFISKIPISKVRSDIERIYDEVKNKGGRFTPEQLEEVNDRATHLPAELQTFPQVFLNWVKNGRDTELAEKDVPKKAKSNLDEHANSVLDGAKVHDKDIEDKTVSEFDDRFNRDAPKETKIKKAERARLEDEAKSGDLQRPVSALKDTKGKAKETAPKKEESTPASRAKEHHDHLTKQAQAGDLKRPLSALKADAGIKKAEPKKQVAVAKSAPKSASKSSSKSSKKK